MTLSYDLAGDGPAVVLMHSSVGDRRMWQPQWDDLLAAGYRVLRLDFRGFGDTPVPDQMFNNAEDVLDLLDSAGIERAALVGASFGGRIAAEFAARWPGRVSALALICAGWRGHAPTPEIIAFSEAEDELIAARDLDRAVALNVDTFVGPAASIETRQLVALMQRRAFEVQIDAPDIETRNVDADPAAITAPTLVVSGKHDLDFFAQIAAYLTAAIPGAKRAELEWAGHLPSLEDPERFNPMLLDFLREHIR